MRKHYHIHVRQIKSLPRGTRNANFLLETDAGRKVLRIYLHKSSREITLERHALTLLAKRGFPAPRLLAYPKKNFLTFNERPAVVYDWLPGSMATTNDATPLEEIGALMGRMHKTLLHVRAPKLFHGVWDYPRIVSLTRYWKPRLVHIGFPHAQELLSFIQKELSLIPWPRHLPVGFTHQDIKPENVLVRNGRVTGILDFDNAYIGELINDLTTTMLWWCTPQEHLDTKRVQRLLKGYERERTLTSQERHLLLGDAFRFRILRELLIWPMRHYHKPDVAEKHVKRLLRLYKNIKRPA